MRKILLVAAIAAGAVVTVPAFAQSMHNDGWFINGSVGQSQLDHGRYDGHDTAYTGNIGYRWALNPQFAWGVEAGYNDLGNIHAKNVFNDHDVVDNRKSQLHGWTAGVNGRFNVAPQWYIAARGGIYGWKGHGTSNDDNPVQHGLDKTSWYGGAGVGYDFSNNVSLGINYDYYNAKKDHVDLSSDVVSVSAEYRF